MAVPITPAVHSAVGAKLFTILPLDFCQLDGQFPVQLIHPARCGETFRVLAQDHPLVSINQHPAAVHTRFFPALCIAKGGKAAVDGAVQGFRLGLHGNGFFHARGTGNVQSQLGQHVRRVGAGIQFRGNAVMFRILGANLLAVAQQGAKGCHFAEVNIIFVDPIFLGVFHLSALYSSALFLHTNLFYSITQAPVHHKGKIGACVSN